MNNKLLNSLKKSLEKYTIIEDKELLFKAIRIYHGWLFSHHYRITYDPTLIRKRNKK